MICNNCGQWMPDGSRVCGKCGAMLSPNAPAPVGGTANAAKAVFASPLALVVAITYSVNAVMSLFSFMSFGGMVDSFSEILPGFILRILHATWIIPAILALVPVVFACIGFWMTYASAAGNTPMTPSGLDKIKVATIIYRVYYYILLALCALVCVISTFIVMSESFGAAIGYFLIYVIVIGIGFGIPIIYFTLAAKTVDAMKNGIYGSCNPAAISTFVPVWLYITAGFNILYMLISMVGSSALYGLTGGILSVSPGFMGTVGTICKIVFSICLGVLIFKFRNAMAGGYSSAGYSAYPNSVGGQYQTGYQQPYQAPVQPQPTAPQFVASKCVSCGADIAPGARFCNVCGADQSAAKEQPASQPTASVCPSCGSPITPGQKFCGSCGTRFE